MRRVVVTGLGALSCAGEGAEVLWRSVVEKRSGIDFIEFGEGDRCWKTLGAVVPAFQPEKYLTQRKSLKVMARDIQLAVAGASLAMQDSGLKSATFDHERFGVIVGSGVLNHELDELSYSLRNGLDEKGKINLKKFGEEGLSALFPLWLLKYLPNMPACHISILFDLQGMNNTITTGASGGLQAIGEAYRVIARGSADLMMAGGAESKVNPVGLSEYKILGAFSGDLPEDPKKNYRPFSPLANGFIVGEGSAFLILEELEHAKRRHAKIYAEITGFGSSFHEGHEIAMRSALRDAGIHESSVSYVQASGIGLPDEDAAEAKAISVIFAGRSKKVWVSGSKPVTGFTGFGAGAMDMVISVMALREQTVPPMMNFHESQKNRAFDVAENSVAHEPLQSVLTNAFGFNGQTASMVTEVYDGR